MNGIVFKRICLSYSEIERTTIEILEVLDNYYRMSDVDHRSIIDFYLRFIKNYDDLRVSIQKEESLSAVFGGLDVKTAEAKIACHYIITIGKTQIIENGIFR